MHARRLVAIVVPVVGVAGLLAAWMWSSRCPVELKLVSMEPSGILDDTEKEFSLVTLGVRPFHRGSFVFADQYITVEAKVANRWVETRNRSTLIWTEPGNDREVQFLLPFGAQACRLHLKYAPESLSLRLWRHLGLRWQRKVYASPKLVHWFWPKQNSILRSNWRSIRPELAFPQKSAWLAPPSGPGRIERV